MHIYNFQGFFPFNTSTVLLQLMKKYDLSCGMKCRLVWDGYGRWEGYKWKPYLKGNLFFIYQVLNTETKLDF